MIRIGSFSRMVILHVADLVAFFVCLVVFSTTTTACFVPPADRLRPGRRLWTPPNVNSNLYRYGGTTSGGGGHGGGSGNGGNDFGRSFFDSSNDPPSLWSSFSNWAHKQVQEDESSVPDDAHDDEGTRETEPSFMSNNTETIRGGATRRRNNPDHATIQSTKTRPASSISKRIKGIFRGKAKRQEDELMQQLQTMPIQRVQVPNTTVLPDSVIQSAALQAGMMGQPLRSDRVHDFANFLTSWYQRQGYVLHSVTGATLRPETATAEITVQEPILHQEPVGIVFVKEMVLDQETGEMLTPRQYKDRHSVQKSKGGLPIGFGDDDSQVSDLNDKVNTTFVATSQGRTRPSRIARALQLRPGQHFQWQGSRWMKIRESGIFGRILQTAPRAMPDGTVQLQIVATETPARNLEYGVGKSLYTGSWEGELDFEHGNLLGGGEVLGLSVRQGAHDAEPSVHVQFSDDRFGMEGGYDIEVFSDYIGDAVEGGLGGSKLKQMKNFFQRKKPPGGGSIETVIEEEETPIGAATAGAPISFDEDSLYNRRGATFRLRNPIDESIMLNSVVSASVERAKTKHGFYEGIGSASLGVGPIVHDLPLGARADIDVRLRVGTRVSRGTRDADTEDDKSGGILSAFTSRAMPYSAVTATTRQIVPLLSIFKRPILLALKQSLTTSTRTLPRHEARAQGHSCKIRGVGSSEPISSAFWGTTELRIPIPLPIANIEEDASLVVFGDWRLSKEYSMSPFERKSSVGLGLRKTVQGIPVQYNVCYSNKEQKVRATFGLGRDFMV